MCAEAGGGKSRLVAELVRVAGGRVALGAADSVFPPEPYLAISRAIPGFTPTSARSQSAARALALLDGCRPPLLIALEDLQFADDGSVAVAATLGISVRTVESHLTSIYRKIGRRRRAALVAWWAGGDDTVRP